MSVVPVLARLLWRPLTLWNVALAVTIGLIAMVVAPFVRVMLLGDRHLEPLEVSAIPAVVCGAGFGAIIAWAAFEALLNPSTILTPGLAIRIRNEVLLLGALIAGCVFAAGLGLASVGTDPMPPWDAKLFAGAMAAMAALAYCAAVHAADPLSWVGRGTGLAAMAGLVVLAALAPPAANLFPGDPLPGLGLVLLLLAGAGAAIAVSFSRERIRRRALLPTAQIGLAYRSHDMRGGVYGAPLAQRARAARIGPARSDAGGVRATLLEVHGWHPGGWLGGTLVQAALWSAVAVGLALIAQRGLKDTPAFARLANDLQGNLRVYRGLTGASIVIPIWFGMSALMTPFVPLATFVRPMSRAVRARIAWRTTATTTAAILLAVAALLGIAALVAVAYAPAADRPPGLPEWARVLISLAIVAPLAHWARLRFVDARPKQPGPLLQGVVAGVVVTALAGLCALFGTGWRAVEHLPLAAQSALIAPALVLTWTAWLSVLKRHFRRADLRV